MATITRIEDLEIWQVARRLAKETFLLTLTSPFKNDFGLKNQINNSANSILSNIAEGFERGGNNEFVNFLSIAKGSCGEIRSQLYVAFDRNYIDQKKLDILQDEYTSLGNRIGRFINYLKDSDIKGLKFKNRNPKRRSSSSNDNPKPETSNLKPGDD
jgi:four helix bundle protein